MGRHVFYTKITPLPTNVPRLLALDLLQSHDEFIRLNPLVLDVKPIEPPRNAEGDEYFSNWYNISEIMKVTGVKVKYDFKGCFHNQSWGMQSHVFAPLGIEFRNTYRIGGNQPGEPREDRELGVNTPVDGLYLREDISFTCNTFMASFVKKQMQEASQVMIDRMRRKAELLDEGKLLAMFENGALKTARPTQPKPAPIMDGEYSAPSPIASSPPTTWESPTPPQNEFSKPGFTNYSQLVGREPSQSSRSSYVQPSQPSQPSSYVASERQRASPETQARPYLDSSQNHFISELPGSTSYQQQQPQPPRGPTTNFSKPRSNGPRAFRSELPGDNTYHSNATPRQPIGVHPAYQNRTSPQPSPRLPGSASNSSSARSSAYSYPEQTAGAARSNSQPDTIAEEPAFVNTDSRQSSMQEWQRNVENDTPIDEHYYRNTRNSHGGASSSSQTGGILPDHQRLADMSLQDPPSLPDRNSLRLQKTAKCPMCATFEGDEPAISHHIETAHSPS